MAVLRAALLRGGWFLLDMTPGVLLALLLFLCLLPWRRRRLAGRGLQSSAAREWGLALLWAFSGGMAALTLTPSWYGWRVFADGLPSMPVFLPGSVNLRPFETWQDPFIFIANVVMFVPFGFFAALLWRGYTWKRALLTGLAITGSIECWQIFIGRAFDIDDLMLNSLGVLVGYWMWLVLFRAAPKFTARFQCGAARPTPSATFPLSGK